MLVALMIVTTTSVLAQPIPSVPAVPVTKDDFRELDNIQGEWINLSHVPVRPMAFDNGFADLWAVNTHDSTVVHYSGLATQPDTTYRVPWSPVSIALWTHPTAATNPERLVVVCRGTYGIALLERATGRTTAFIGLPAEPGDIVIVGDSAWVACSGADSVVKVDLTTEAITQEVVIPAEHPLFLTVDGTDVLVTPQFSGNNTAVDKLDQARDRTADRRGILDMTDTVNVAPNGGLPDADVIRISSSGAITQTVSGVGTILFGHAINPDSGELWVLNTDANNRAQHDTNYPSTVTDINKLQSEPSIRGTTVRNRVTRVDLATGTTFITELEVDSAGVYDDARTIGQPYALDFGPTGQADAGHAYIVGLLTNRVVEYDEVGAFVQSFDILPSGSIARAIHFDSANDRIYVYCWGTNEIRVYTLGAPVILDAVMDLGFDPAPATVQQGRQTFYDGSHSLHGDESCATCHVEGRMDQMAWDLSNRPADDKGPLVTQTLVGIERMRPFHWRGEQMQGLVDFNPAFDNLLGGSGLDQTPGGEFDMFEDFVFSLQAPANPIIDPTRIINNNFAPPVPSVLPPVGTQGAWPAFGDAVNGQRIWFDELTVGNNTCNDCHTLPTGTNADVIADGGSDLHQKRARLMVTGFNDMWRKSQEPVLIDFFEPDGTIGTRRYPTLGHGFAHSGAAANLIEFSRGGGTLSNKEVADVAAFQEMIDTGIAPASHVGILLDQDHLSALTEINDFLIDQAEKGNCDVIVIGKSFFGASIDVRWVYNTDTNRFQSEFAPLTRDISFFDTQAQNGRGSNIFMGVPLGMGERFAIDFDHDGLFNVSETRTYGTNPLDPDSDGDTYEDGHEADNGSNPADGLQIPLDTTPATIDDISFEWVNARNVKINFETNEPTTYSIDLASAQHTLPTVSSDETSRFHNVVVNGLLPSTLPLGPTHQYSGTLKVIDRGGNVTTLNIPADPLDAESLPFTRPSTNTTVVLSNLSWIQPIQFSLGGTAVSASATATVNTKFLVPNSPTVADVVLLARVLILRQGETIAEVSTTFTSANLFTDITVQGNPGPDFYTGPYLMSSASNASGIAQFDFDQGGLASGDKVILVIDGGAEVLGTFPPAGIDFAEGIARWSLPDTPVGFRSLEIPIP